jgi:adenine-specific DNA-methyltransferase
VAAQTLAAEPVLQCGDCLELMRALPDNSVDLIATDPPYFKVKGEAWDNQWSTPAQFLAWMDLLAEQWQRVLKPNGSLYVFASPRMSARVEVLLDTRFNVLNRVRWVKEAGWHKRADKEAQRSFSSPWEECVFAEHKGADNMAKGEAGYAAKCDELCGFIFEPLRAYLASERDRAGFTTRKVAEAFQRKSGSRTVTGMAGHWLERVQWTLPTEENYLWLRALFGEGFLAREYEDLRREYEDLRREYEDLRRPFNVTADVPYTDVWTFPTVSAHKRGKHPCEKPAAMMEHIIMASSRPGTVVLDCFMGSGATGEAAVKLGRCFIGMEMGKEYFAGACARIAMARERFLAAAPTVNVLPRDGDLPDQQSNIHSRGLVISQAHLIEAATALEGVETMDADFAALRKAYEEASGGKSPTLQAIVAAIHRGAR